jgi:hypothetical protein
MTPTATNLLNLIRIAAARDAYGGADLNVIYKTMKISQRDLQSLIKALIKRGLIDINEDAGTVSLTAAGTG